MSATSRKNNSKTKGAVLAFAGAAVLAGSLLGGAGETTPSGYEAGGVIHGGGSSVYLKLNNGDSSITSTAPTSAETFIAPSLISTVSYTKVLNLGYSVTAPNGVECALATHNNNTSWTSGNYSQALDFSSCESGATGQYTLKVYDIDQPTVYASTSFKYQTFSLGYSVADQNRDPIVIVQYPEGVEFIALSAYREGGSTAVLNSFRHYVENNEDRVDEIALPFKLVDAPNGTYTVTATAYKDDTTQINSQNASITSESFTYAK